MISGKFWLKIDNFLLVIVPFPMRISFQTSKKIIFDLKYTLLSVYRYTFKKTWSFWESKQYFLWQIAIIQFRFQKFNLSLYRFFITYPTKTGNSLSPVCSFITCLTTIEINYNFTFQIMIMVSVLFMYYLNKFRF